MNPKRRSTQLRRTLWTSFLAAALTLPTLSAARAETTAATAPAALPALPSPLKPADVVKYASEHRAEITAASAKTAALAQVPKQVGALPEPMVMASIDHLPISLEGVNLSLMVQQEFPLSGVLGARERSAEADVKGAAAKAQTIKLDVEFQALAAYLMVVEAQRMSAVLDEQVAIAKQMVAVTKARLLSTEAATLDILRAELDSAKMEGEKKALDADLHAAASMLEAALGRPVKGEAPVCELTFPTGEPPSLTDLVKLALEKRPELAQMKASVTKANAEVDVMNSMYGPMAFVRLGGATTMMEGPGIMLMVGVNIPLWREKLGAGVAEAKAMGQMASAETTAMSTMIEGEVGSARQGVVAARTRLATVRDKVLPLSKSVLTLTMSTYATGHVPFVSVLEAAKATLDARTEEVIAEVKLAAAWARLGRAVGDMNVGSSAPKT